MFFAPAFRPKSEITVWGPEAPEASLEDRIARYISAPLSPVEVRELPCDVSFRDTPGGGVGDRPGADPGGLGEPSRPDAGLPHHRGRRVALLHPRPRARARRGPGRAGARVDLGLRAGTGRDLLIHDCQYTDDEYPDHVGWGHSACRRLAVLRPARGRPAHAAVPPRSRCTPTMRWTACRPPWRTAGPRWELTRPRWSWRWSAARSRSALCRPPPPEVSPRSTSGPRGRPAPPRGARSRSGGPAGSHLAGRRGAARAAPRSPPGPARRTPGPRNGRARRGAAPPLCRAGCSITSRSGSPTRKKACRRAPAAVGPSRTRRRSSPAASSAGTVRSRSGLKATTWSSRVTPLG